jgi:hypothetical protein
MSTMYRPRASFGVKKRNVVDVLTRAQSMCSGITEHAATFVSPTVTMAAFLALITALALSQQNAVGTKARGSTTLRNTRRDAVWTAMESLRAYVQALADVVNAENAAALIESAGLRVAAVPTHQKAALTATLTTTPGVVHLDVHAALLVGPASLTKKVTFNWQWSGDGGATWHDLRSTPYGNTDVPGLALMGTYGFRASVTIGRDAGAWSQAVSLLVH